MADSSLDKPGQGGQGHGDGGNVRHQQQGHDDSEEIRQQFLDDLLDLDMAHLAAGEQDGTHRRGDGADAQVHANLQSRGNPRKASWHYQIDDKQVIQSFLDTTRCWHAGKKIA